MSIKVASSTSISSLLGTVGKTAEAVSETVSIVHNVATMGNAWVNKHKLIQATDHKLEIGTHEARSKAKLAAQLADEARAIEKKSTDKKWQEYFTKYESELDAILKKAD